jgi:hypothetical protein
MYKFYKEDLDNDCKECYRLFNPDLPVLCESKGIPDEKGDRKSGLMGVPVIMVDDKVVIGFDVRELDRLLV